MSQRRSLIRKVIYFSIMVALLFAISYISDPATVGSGTQTGSSGGVLAQLRTEHGLSQANLGDIDPTSETIKLAMFGMRGVASTVLWEKAREYQKTQDWTNMSATLEQIIRLQPNFITVWKFQSWNYSYNVSAEFDDYRDRYHWVKKGIHFLQEGTHYNENEPRLISEIGRFIAHKIGVSDERRQFRRLFRADYEFHRREPPRNDNWLVGREWFLKSEEVVKNTGIAIKGTSPLLFYSEAPMSQINYSTALEEDGGADGRGVYGEIARQAWGDAHASWVRYGQRDLVSALGIPFHLNDYEPLQATAKKKLEQLEALQPGLRGKIAQEKLAKLSAAERQALETPMMQRTEQQYELSQQAQTKLIVTHADLAERVPKAQREQARKLAQEVAAAEEQAGVVDRQRQIVNFNYWKTRCEIEHEADTVKARELIARGDYEYDYNADPAKALVAYDEGLAKWRAVIDKYPTILEDDAILGDLVASINHYKVVLGQEERRLPEDFILQDAVDSYEKRNSP